MLKSLAISTLLLVNAHSQNGNPACDILKPADVVALIGAGAVMMSVSTNPSGAACMYQLGEKAISVMYVKQTSAENAALLWAAKKRVVAGNVVTGWRSKAYEGAMGIAPAIGLTKGMLFTEVKVIDDKQKMSVIAPKLRAVMKGVASRL